MALTKLTLTLIYAAGAALLLVLARAGARAMPARYVRARFWLDQLGRIVATAIIVIAALTIWFDNPGRFATVATVITAGLTIALQKVITSVAGYLAILRGNVFTVGDRITMGGVRGDVVSLTYLRTTVMEMGQPPTANSDAPAIWVAGRQYTGRVVTITNDKVFETPVYNYTRQFPFLWDEMRIPIRYGADWRRAEEILLNSAHHATDELMSEAQPALQDLMTRFPNLERPQLEPRVYLHLTDNWNELTLRFLAREHGVRDLKNRISREILEEFTAAKIEVASSTMDVTLMPSPPPREPASPWAARS